MSPRNLPTDPIVPHEHLAGTDPRFAALIEQVGPPDLREPHSSAFEALCRSIVFQQLAGAAASTIWGRFRALVPGPLKPDLVLALDEADLRAAGLSGAKAAAIRDLAVKAADGTVPLRNLWRLTDDEVVERLVVVRGIGPWTAQMFLMFQLRRPDVWPVGDLGVRKGYQLVHQLPELPTPDELQDLGEPFRPHRTTAAWYMWRAVDDFGSEQLAGARSSKPRS
jgi:3-methyladenine DNA glycosylase/8-oxoguanine DNA glycosylase